MDEIKKINLLPTVKTGLDLYQTKAQTLVNHNAPTTSITFNDVLQDKLKEQSLVFSKHASKRVEERDIDINHESLQRLNNGVQLASDKGLIDALVLIDNTAFLVNVPNMTVITAVENENIKGNVFSNIDGAVIV